jgi:hypothetical protein
VTRLLKRAGVDRAAVAAAADGLGDRGATCQVYLRAGGRNVCVNAVNAGAEAWPGYSAAASRRAAVGGRRMLPVLDSGEGEDRLWIAYDMGSAKSLSEHRGHLLPTATALRVLADVASALDGAAAQGMFAWELPPASVFVARKGARLGDLGTAREGLAGAEYALGGDPAYVPPEVLGGGRAGERSNVYLFGALMHYLLTGRRPQNVGAARGANGQLDMPASTRAIVATTMAADPEDRPTTVGEAHEMARRALRGEPPGGTRKRSTRRVASVGRRGDNAPAATRGPETATGKSGYAKGARAEAAPAKPAPAKPPPAKPAPAKPAPTKAAPAKAAPAKAAPAKAAPAKPAPAKPAKAATGKRAAAPTSAKRPPAKRAAPKAASAKRAAAKRAAAKRAPAKRAPAKRAPAKRAPAKPARAKPATGKRAAKPASAKPATRQRAAKPAPVIVLFGALLLGAVAGLLLGASPEPDPARAQTVTAGGISVTLPSGRHRVGSGDDTLLVRAPGSRLRARILNRPTAPPTQARPVRLATVQAWRHARGKAVRYAIPTNEGTLEVSCRTTSSGSSRQLRLCERTASTIELRRAKALPLAYAAEESRRLTAAITALSAGRDAARSRLRDAPTPDDQHLVAQGLARRHRRAADVLHEIDGAEAVEAAARRVADAYSSLAAAARSGSAARWEDASERVRRSDAVLAEAVASAL